MITNQRLIMVKLYAGDGRLFLPNL